MSAASVNEIAAEVARIVMSRECFEPYEGFNVNESELARIIAAVMRRMGVQ